MLKYFLSLLVITAAVSNCFAQDEHDALRYAYTIYQGTARSSGIGGALGSMGADFGCLSVNPAGIGIYRNNEMMFTPSFLVSGNEGTYRGNQISARESNLHISNFGLVVTNDQQGKLYKRTGWKTINFALGMNRVANFKNEYTYSGRNDQNSLIESFADDFNSLGGLNSNTLQAVNFSAYGAYQTYLIDKGSGADSTRAVSYVPYTAGLRQGKRVYERGGMNEYLFSIGGNYKDVLMLGASIGIVSLKYKRTLRFDEEDVSGDLNNDFRYMNYSEFLTTSGTGVNIKLGAIVKPNSFMRFGVALHSPTHIELNDASSISIVSHTDSLLLQSNPAANPITEYIQDSTQVFNYSQTTPYKALVSAMFLFGKKGFLTADAEFVDYASMRYNFGINYEKESDAINQVIHNTYTRAVNFRVGAEVKLSEMALRTGFAYYGSPYSNMATGGERLQFCGGIGYRQPYWFIDAAYMHTLQERQELPYILARSNANVLPATIRNSSGQVVLTAGVKF